MLVLDTLVSFPSEPLTFIMPTCFNELACNCWMHNKCIGFVQKSYRPFCYFYMVISGPEFCSLIFPEACCADYINLSSSTEVMHSHHDLNNT